MLWAFLGMTRKGDGMAAFRSLDSWRQKQPLRVFSHLPLDRPLGLGVSWRQGDNPPMLRGADRPEGGFWK